MKIRLSNIYAKADIRPSGYIDDCVSHGKVDGEWIEFSEDAWRYLCRKYRMLEPNKTDLAENYAEATAPLKGRGFEIIPEEEYKLRLAICDAPCENRINEICMVCGNNPIRLYWKHAKCPRGFWNKIDISLNEQKE